jgi:hypothetical protein
MFQIIPALLILLLQSQSQTGGAVAKRGSIPDLRYGSAVERIAIESDLHAQHALLIHLISSGASRISLSKPLSQWILAFRAAKAAPCAPISRRQESLPVFSFSSSGLLALNTAQRLRDGPL